MRPGELVSVAAVGLRLRPLRTALSALGVAIGIAALVAVTGISASSRADLLAEIDALGTNHLAVRAGQSFLGEDTSLPEEAVSMVRRIGPVEAATGVTTVGESVRRTDHIPAAETGGLSVVATDTGLADTVGATVRDGRFLDDATDGLPAVVLGSAAAERLGIDRVSTDAMVWIGDTWFTVIGILDPIPLFPNLDVAAFIGYDVAAERFGTSRSPDTIHVRTDPGRVGAVSRVLPATVQPLAPNEVEVANPADALAAKEAVDEGLQGLLLGLGAVALLVGGIGIANVMVVAVLERRGEIGLRRALGASRRHIRAQFLAEATLLSLLGGLGGVAAGVAVTVGWARLRGMVVDLPPTAAVGALGAAVVVGVIAGLSPATRAARLSPAEALRPA